jgi:hypothetical protein
MGPDTKKYTPKDYMTAYLNMKDVLDQERGVWKKRETELKGKMAGVLDLLKTAMSEADLDQVKTAGVGIAFYKKKSFLNIIDHIKANDLFHVLTKKLSKNAVVEIIDETKQVFPGAELGEIRELHVNRK